MFFKMFKNELLLSKEKNTHPKKFEIEEFYFVNSIQKKIERKKKWDQLLDVEMQKQKQFWNRGAKRSPNPTTSHIHFTYWPYQVDLIHIRVLQQRLACFICRFSMTITRYAH